MALATLPPAGEIVKSFAPRNLGYNPSTQYWALLGSSEQSPWKKTALSKISMLRQTGRSVLGLGDFALSEQVVKAAQKLIGEIDIESLPLPTVAPVSGGAIFISWQSGRKCVEATVYHDGESLVEAIENQRVDDEKSKENLPSILQWLVEG